MPCRLPSIAKLSDAAGLALKAARACWTGMKGSVSRGQALVAALVAVLPVSAVLAGFAMTGGDAAPQPAPQAEQQALAPRMAAITVNPAETTASLLARLGITDASLENFVFTHAEAAAFAYPGRGFLAEAEVNSDGTAKRITLYTAGRASGGRKISIERDGSSFKAESASFAWEKHRFAASAKVTSTIAAAAKTAGVPPSILEQAAAVPYQSGKLLSSARRGDFISFAYETRSLHGHESGQGKLLAISVRKGSRDTSLFWLEDGSPSGGFYSAEGGASQQSFRRYPLDSFRLTSSFSIGRRHPVTGRVRAHKGVDLAAPRGAPVYAAASGIVQAADRRLRGYGNRVDIRHGGGIITRYAHLAGYARSIRPGAKITKGQLIGYCGSSGLSTGSHVHYEFIRNGVALDPVHVALPEGPHVSRKHLAAAQPRVRAISSEFRRMAAEADSAKTSVVAAAEFRSGQALADASRPRTAGS